MSTQLDIFIMQDEYEVLNKGPEAHPSPSTSSIEPVNLAETAPGKNVASNISDTDRYIIKCVTRAFKRANLMHREWGGTIFTPEQITQCCLLTTDLPKLRRYVQDHHHGYLYAETNLDDHIFDMYFCSRITGLRQPEHMHRLLGLPYEPPPNQIVQDNRVYSPEQQVEIMRALIAENKRKGLA